MPSGARNRLIVRLPQTMKPQAGNRSVASDPRKHQVTVVAIGIICWVCGIERVSWASVFLPRVVWFCSYHYRGRMVQNRTFFHSIFASSFALLEAFRCVLFPSRPFFLHFLPCVAAPLLGVRGRTTAKCRWLGWRLVGRVRRRSQPEGRTLWR